MPFTTIKVIEGVFSKEEKAERLEKIFGGKNSLNVNGLIEHVFENVQKFSEGVEQSDDITCLALKYLKG